MKSLWSTTWQPVHAGIRPLAAPETSTPLHVIFLLLISWFFFFHGLADRDVWSSHEARAGQNAQRMLDDRSFGLPRLFDDRFDFQKPPLYYWLVAAVTTIRGGRVDAWTIRLPAALAATGCLFLLWHWLRRNGRRLAAIVSPLLLATMVHFTWLGRTGRIDMPLAFTIALAIFTLSSRRWWWLGGLSLAAGLLLKGPIGFVLPVAVVLGSALWSREIRSWRLLAGPTIGLLAGLPWFIWANVETKGEFVRVFFWYHNVQRALGDAEALSVHPWWYYLPRLMVDALPWSLLLPFVLIYWIHNRDARLDRGMRLGLTWMLVIVAVLSCARFKRSDYLIPAYPGLALLLGCAAEKLLPSLQFQWRRRAAAALVSAVLLLVGAWTWWLHDELPRVEPMREQRTFARRIREIAPTPNIILFFRAEAHALTFHLGRPVNTFLEWENLDIWAGRPGTHYIVMPPECAEEWSRHVVSGKLEIVAQNSDCIGGPHEKPLVLVRTIPGR